MLCQGVTVWTKNPHMTLGYFAYRTLMSFLTVVALDLDTEALEVDKNDASINTLLHRLVMHLIKTRLGAQTVPRQ